MLYLVKTNVLEVIAVKVSVAGVKDDVIAIGLDDAGMELSEGDGAEGKTA